MSENVSAEEIVHSALWIAAREIEAEDWANACLTSDAGGRDARRHATTRIVSALQDAGLLVKDRTP